MSGSYKMLIVKKEYIYIYTHILYFEFYTCGLKKSVYNNDKI